jgi:hypothetical protein
MTTDVAVPPRRTLRELADEACALDAALSSLGGEVSADMEAQLDTLALALVQKADGTRDYLAALQDYERVLTAEIERLTDMRASHQGRIARYKHYILRAMQAMNTQRLDGQYGHIRRQKNPVHVVVDDAGRVPETFKRTEVVVSVDRSALKEALQLTSDGVLRIDEVGPDMQVLRQTIVAHLEQGEHLRIG